MANKEISDITDILGCGRGKDFNIEKCRFKKIIFMADADIDGRI